MHAHTMAMHSAESALFTQGIGESLAYLVPQIRHAITKCQEASNAHMQPTVDQIVEMCLANNLAVRRNIQLRNTGIHPENRAKTGVDQLNAQALALKISLQGYSEAKLENPMGFEKAAPGTPAASAQEKFMENNFKLASGYLNPIPWHDTEYLPVTLSLIHI